MAQLELLSVLFSLGVRVEIENKQMYGFERCYAYTETFVYKFTVGDQVGTYWWHAHYKVITFFDS
jgi:hypothetical protein